MLNNLPITQIGSLPFDDVNKAIDYSFSHSIPFLPELPKISKSEFITSKIKTLGIATESFLSRVQYENPSSVKIQFIGATTLRDYSSDFSFDDYISHLLKQLDHYRYNIPEQTVIWISFDDPAPIDPELLEQTLSAIEKQKYKQIKLGIHSCSDNKWEEIYKRNLDFISFDLQLSKDTIFTEGFKIFLNKGGTLFVGAIPTLGDYDFEQTEKELRAFLAKVNSPNIVITPACGIGLKEFEKAQIYYEQLTKLSQIKA